MFEVPSVQKGKIRKNGGITTTSQCSLPNQRIHMDLFGPCKTSDAGNKYVLTMTDAFTKYAEIVAIPYKEAVTVADAIFTKWICRYGCPAIIHTDMGKEFINKITTELYAKLDIKGSKTTPAHPQCNSQAEVFNKTLAKYMKNSAPSIRCAEVVTSASPDKRCLLDIENNNSEMRESFIPHKEATWEEKDSLKFACCCCCAKSSFNATESPS